MEYLSLKDRRRRQSIAFASKPDSYDRFFARLPTPEESTPSHRSSDDERRNKVTRRHSPDQPPGHAERLRADTLFPQMGSRQRIPDSPPYQSSDGHKPSLPPLKTVLGHSLTSPPRSPTFHCPSVQPSPQEPAYTSATYKPPSLYPQKKQRTEYVLEPVPPLTTNESSASPIFRSDTLDRPIYRAPVSPRTRPGESRRLSLQPNAGYAPISPGPSQRSSQLSFVEPSPNAAISANGAPQYRYQQHSAASPPEYGRPHVRQSVPYCSSPQGGFDARFDRRDSTQAPYEAAYSSDYRRDPPVVDPHAQHPRAPGNEQYERPQYPERVEMPPIERRTEEHYTPYQTNQPSFFMPSQYDYRHGRARKRSNLPKQSTEIMKTWFDQNITNPYPSEEQKAIFSNATGISMTQVSNWFINHRRRCPELRDKRERTRGRECDI